jgi:hypothetical protein
VGFSTEEATSNLLRDLEQKSFRDALDAEMTVAWRDPALSWQHLLDECDVAYFDSEEEARSFVVERIMKPAALGTG